MAEKNPFMQTSSSTRWANIKNEINNEIALKKKSPFKQSPFKRDKPLEEKSFFTRTSKPRPSKQFNLTSMQNDFPALKRSEK